MLGALTVGSVASWLTLMALIGGGFIFARGGGGAALSSLESANRVLEKRVHTLEEEARTKDHRISAQDVEIAELKARTDIAASLKPLLEWSALHENRAQERHEAMLKTQDATLKVLEMVGDRLGPDPNGKDSHAT